MKPKAIVGLFISVAASLPAYSGSDALARRLVEVLRYDMQFKEAHAQCLKTNSAIPPEKFLNITPENPGPVPPGSALWPKVLAAYENYWGDVCARPTRDEYLSALTKTYARTLDDSSLNAAIAFYSTDSGKRLIDANTAAVRDIYAEWRRLNAQSYPDAVARLQRTLESVGEEAAMLRCRERAATHTAAAPCEAKKPS
jgi:hypothetical protein